MSLKDLSADFVRVSNINEMTMSINYTAARKKEEDNDERNSDEPEI